MFLGNQLKVKKGLLQTSVKNCCELVNIPIIDILDPNKCDQPYARHYRLFMNVVMAAFKDVWPTVPAKNCFIAYLDWRSYLEKESLDESELKELEQLGRK